MAQDAREETRPIELPLGLVGIMEIEAQRAKLSVSEVITLSTITGLNRKYWDAGHPQIANMFVDYIEAWAGTDERRRKCIEVEHGRGTGPAKA